MGDITTHDRAGALVGRILRDKYRIVRRLGSGGWGAVFEAEHLLLRRSVAIKLLHPDIAAEARFADRFRREAVTLARIGHPGIVEVVDFDRTDDGVDFIVLELLRGEALSKRIARKDVLPLTEALPMFIQIADALKAAHAAGIVHRDLKPDNVFVCEAADGTERVKLLDFGVAKVTPGTTEASVSVTHTGALLGTPLYMSPEQVRTDHSLDHRTDIYSLGVLMYEALSGVIPFTSVNFAQLVMKILDEPPLPLYVRRPDLPAALTSLTSRMLEKDKADRPADCEEVLEVLRSIDVADAQAFDDSEVTRVHHVVDLPLRKGSGVLDVTVNIADANSSEVVTRPKILAFEDDLASTVVFPANETESADAELPMHRLPKSLDDRTTAVKTAKKPPSERPKPLRVVSAAVRGRRVDARLLEELSLTSSSLWVIGCIVAFITAASITYAIITHAR